MKLLSIFRKKSIKTLAVFIAGAFLVTGAAFAAGTDNKYEHGDKRGYKSFKQGSRKIQADPDKVAEKVAKSFNISKEEVSAYQAKGYTGRDLFTAGIFARTSGKSYDSVIAMKTKENNWRDIGKKLNITEEQVRAAGEDMAVEHMSEILNIDKNSIKNLRQEGYKHPDIMTAAVLAKRTGKSINDVISLKKINNNWQDVATSLGVSKEDFKNDMGALFAQAGFKPIDKKLIYKAGPKSDKKPASSEKR